MGLTASPANDPAAAAPTGRRVLIERYEHATDFRRAGGVEHSSLHLAAALHAHGIATEWYTDRDYPTIAALDARMSTGTVDAVLPLVESPLFLRSGSIAPRHWSHRIVRVWHDTTAIAKPWAVLPPCPAHGAGTGTGEGVCHADAICRDDSATNVFLYDDAWTRCFPQRHVIPWSVDHLPVRAYRATDGPVLLLAGKMPLDDVRHVAQACAAAGVGTRIIFSNWSQAGQRAKRHFAEADVVAGREVIEHYDIAHEHERVFGGISAALVLSRYHETFNLLAAEAAHFGIPVVALGCSGATLRFAAVVVDDPEAAADLIRNGRFRTLTAPPRSQWGWRDVGACWASLIERIGGGARDRLDLPSATQNRRAFA